MELELKRDTFTEYSTTGQLLVDGKLECFTLEDKDRHLEDGIVKKIYGRTAIPRGLYKVVLDWSPKYKRNMPHVLDVPGFEGIRIHSGNKHEDTEGCILVGKSRNNDWIRDSQLALDALLAKIIMALDAGEDIWLTIT